VGDGIGEVLMRRTFGPARVAGVLLAAALALPLHAQIPVKIYAQELVDQTVAKNPDLLVVVMHVTPPKGPDNVIIASNIGRIGKLGDEDDMRVINTGKPNLEVAHGGQRYEVELVLRDVAGETIGALGLVWPYKAGQDKVPFERKAEMIRDGLARRILNAANLMDPYPFERLATTKTGAQKLVDQTQARHSDLLVLALRAPPRSSAELVVLGSTFGRHGKKADADDMKIFEGNKPVTGVYSNGKRFGVDLQLHDAAGRKIGTMNVGYAYRESDDPKALLRKARQLRDELQKRIASAESLDELDP
jgi:hypothetical protein